MGIIVWLIGCAKLKIANSRKYPAKNILLCVNTIQPTMRKDFVSTFDQSFSWDNIIMQTNRLMNPWILKKMMLCLITMNACRLYMYILQMIPGGPGSCSTRRPGPTILNVCSLRIKILHWRSPSRQRQTKCTDPQLCTLIKSLAFLQLLLIFHTVYSWNKKLQLVSCFSNFIYMLKTDFFYQNAFYKF